MTQSRSSESVQWRATTSMQNPRTPLREFLRTETGSAAVLLAATVAALAWANIGASSYAAVWSTLASVSVGHAGGFAGSARLDQFRARHRSSCRR